MSLHSMSRLFRSALRTQLVPAANLTSKPAKHHIAVWEQAIALTAMFITILGPSGWVLSHLDDYKKNVR